MKLKENVKKYWEVWQNYEEKDLVYRISLIVSAILIFILSLSLIFLSLRKPLIISIKNGVPSVTSYEEDKNTLNQEEVRVFIQNFIRYYYNWAPETVEKNLKTSLSFFEDPLQKQIREKIKEKVYDSQQKVLSQSVYVKDVSFNEKTSQVTLLSERIFTVQKVKLTNDFKVIFKLKKQRRTKNNPSGLLISELTEPFDQN